MKLHLFTLILFQSFTFSSNSSKEELEEMKRTALALIESNRKIIRLLKKQENNNYKILNEQSQWVEDANFKIKKIRKKTQKRKEFKLIYDVNKNQEKTPKKEFKDFKEQKFELIKQDSEYETNPVTFIGEFTWEFGLRNMSDGSGDGFSNDQEEYFHLGKKVNPRKEYFFEMKRANLGYEGDGKIKKLGLGFKNYIGNNEKKMKPYICYGVDYLSTKLNSYNGVGIVNGTQSKNIGFFRLGAEYYCTKRFDVNFFYEKTGGNFNFENKNGNQLKLESQKDVYGLGVKYKW